MIVSFLQFFAIYTMPYTDNSLFYALPVAFFITALLIPTLAPLAMRIGLTDAPCNRRLHASETPLVGGITIFIGLMFAILILDTSLSGYRALFAGSALLLLVGVLDDFHELSARFRFFYQVLAALLMTQWGGIAITDLGSLLGTESLPLGIWSVPFTVFCVVGVINAVNMIDGMDGLSGSIMLLTALLLALLAFSVNQIDSASILSLFAASCAAFLVFNLRTHLRKRIHVFLGDAGSMMGGYILCWFLIDLGQEPAQAYAPVTALWLFAIPIIDTVATMIGRVMRKKSPFSADRTHLHHLLLSSGLSVTTTLLVILVAIVLLASIGILAENHAIPEWIMTVAFLTISFIYLSVSNKHKLD
ncbi:MraY family glycosyltransferase [Solemya velum gill symbiont]|uniref:MraY family glycosyltransferase n=1 Tax=Solemya velum gill symbiont TaxID=2340 RepID=UPI0009965003|nr:MraY family glycosyltransferase [Solemya velum gill symbiont]